MSEAIYIVSDIHLGSEFCRAEEFIYFLNSLPDKAALVLNGDTVTHSHRPMKEKDIQILDRLRSESLKRAIIWVNGNHDQFFDMTDKGAITFTDKHIIDKRIAVWHGHDCDWVRRFLYPLVATLYLVHRIRVRLGFKEIPTSEFAKKIPQLYRPYKRLFITNAFRFARKNGLSTVICGHVHHAEDLDVDGIRYINTGSWLEDPISYIIIENDAILLKEIKQDKKCNE